MSLVHAAIVFVTLTGQVASEQHIEVEKKICGISSRAAVVNNGQRIEGTARIVCK